MKKLLTVGVLIKGTRVSLSYSERFDVWCVEVDKEGYYHSHGGIKTREEADRIYREYKEEVRKEVM